jgi:hypothetical protein
MKKTQVFFWVGKVWREREDLSDEERLERPIPPVSMKFSFIASSGTRIQQLADLRLP